MRSCDYTTGFTRSGSVSVTVDGTRDVTGLWATVTDVISEEKAETPDSHGLLAQLTKRIMTSSPRPKGRWTRIWATPSMTRSAATAAIRATARQDGAH